MSEAPELSWREVVIASPGFPQARSLWETRPHKHGPQPHSVPDARNSCPSSRDPQGVLLRYDGLQDRVAQVFFNPCSLEQKPSLPTLLHPLLNLSYNDSYNVLGARPGLSTFLVSTQLHLFFLMRKLRPGRLTHRVRLQHLLLGSWPRFGQ